MGRIAGIPNKLTSEVKENLQGLSGNDDAWQMSAWYIFSPAINSKINPVIN